MTLDRALEVSPRISIANVTTGESIYPQFNPQAFKLSLQIAYSQLSPPGAGYQPLQFSNTGNPTIPLELFYYSRDADERARRVADEKFLLSLCYPRRGAGNVSAGGPPRALVTWQGYASLMVVVRQIDLSITRFAVDGLPVEEQIVLNLEELRDGQIFSEDVRAQGLLRASPRAVGGDSGTAGEFRSIPPALRGGQ